MATFSVASQEMCKRAAVLSNKVMKHAFVAEMERILDADEKKSHADIAEHVRVFPFAQSYLYINIKISAYTSYR